VPCQIHLASRHYHEHPPKHPPTVYLSARLIALPLLLNSACVDLGKAVNRNGGHRSGFPLKAILKHESNVEAEHYTMTQL